ncbi:hypothetical protein FRC17_001141, partial [Serendipita sp. 399]
MFSRSSDYSPSSSVEESEGEMPQARLQSALPSMWRVDSKVRRNGPTITDEFYERLF